jgi:hypothetical protein
MRRHQEDENADAAKIRFSADERHWLANAQSTMPLSHEFLELFQNALIKVIVSIDSFAFMFLFCNFACFFWIFFFFFFFVLVLVSHSHTFI